MGFLHPRDPRWQGPARWYLCLDLAKNIILFAFVILVIVEGALYRHWYMDYHDTVEFDSGETAADFFLRIGLALLPDILSTIPTHILLHKNAFHPVYALTQALVIFCLYPPALFLNFLITYSDETGYAYIDAWQALCWAEMGVQGVLAVLWAGMVGCSCVAVHKWRGEKRDRRVIGVGKEGFELREGEVGRDGRDGDGNGSLKREREFV